ncbi:hypothetical protein F5Y00DRAFT_40581 [Daldinia vernicosa]|uniref:uncharacterized protein n=1 Tax=Daldinia vernicosa TaxID=114800 RepID=UPI00200877BB|nr:uncharacterized protein F5Y00DRAFT_40581 [Daldinia vernicosa]KAI0850108.1 hypothetical protein F5Y00DRAFT_40581 [Daldinia vernicosa]
MDPISPDTLAYTGSALDAFEELAKTQTYVELLHVAHSLWCGPSCSRSIACKFLHYKMPESRAPEEARLVPSHRYNKCTANYFTLMGGEGYESGFSQEHQGNFWPPLEASLRRIDRAREKGGFLFCDYTDWTKKQDTSAKQTAQSLCRDVIQWMAVWTGIDLKTSPLSVWLVAMLTSPDDICMPPLDVVHQKFRLYGRSLRNLVQAMVNDNWGRDATHVLLCSIRQLIFQYVEKVEFEGGAKSNVGIHAQMGGRHAEGIWDSIVLRTHTAGTYACMIIVSRIAGLGLLKENWVLGSSSSACISMDLAKSAARIYHVDNHQPTVSFGEQNMQPTLERRRKIGYHSVYLDMMDDLVNTGCPEPLLHVSGTFVAVQLVHRYVERSLGCRIPIHPAMADALRSIYGDEPTDARLDGLFHLRWLVSGHDTKQKTRAKSTLCPDLLAACLKRQQQRESVWKPDHANSLPDSILPIHSPDNDSPDANEWITGVHQLSQRANNPKALQKLLTSHVMLNSRRLSIDQLNAVGSQDDIWALCMACKVDCSKDCEWLAFAKYIQKQFCSAS